MLAAVAREPGRLDLARLPVPEPLAGWVGIRVRAFGLNRTEKFLERGGWPVSALSPVAPLVNGIECAGEVVANGPPIGDDVRELVFGELGQRGAELLVEAPHDLVGR